METDDTFVLGMPVNGSVLYAIENNLKEVSQSVAESSPRRRTLF